MTNPFKRQEPWTPNLSEIHEYVNDLHRITLLRDKSEGEEREDYDNIIHCMQRVMVVINKPPVVLK